MHRLRKSGRPISALFQHKSTLSEYVRQIRNKAHGRTPLHLHRRPRPADETGCISPVRSASSLYPPSNHLTFLRRSKRFEARHRPGDGHRLYVPAVMFALTTAHFGCGAASQSTGVTADVATANALTAGSFPIAPVAAAALSPRWSLKQDIHIGRYQLQIERAADEVA